MQPSPAGGAALPERLDSSEPRQHRHRVRTTLIIDDEILAKAARLTGVQEKAALVQLGLQALIARESAKRLAQLGGTEKGLRPVPRRRG